MSDGRVCVEGTVVVSVCCERIGCVRAVGTGVVWVNEVGIVGVNVRVGRGPCVCSVGVVGVCAWEGQVSCVGRGGSVREGEKRVVCDIGVGVKGMGT